jgi:hypothetical protein
VTTLRQALERLLARDCLHPYREGTAGPWICPGCYGDCGRAVLRPRAGSCGRSIEECAIVAVLEVFARPDQLRARAETALARARGAVVSARTLALREAFAAVLEPDDGKRAAMPGNEWLR